MKSEDFELLSGLLKQRSGLVLSKDKAYLLETRLTPLARQHGFKSLDDLVHEIRLNKPEDVLTQITEAMTTNESMFFRDRRPFEQFRKVVLPGMMRARTTSRRIRVWSAGCSSGQEPFSLCFLIREAGEMLADWQLDITATDISAEMLNKAKAGLYTQFEVQRGLPIMMLIRYFHQIDEKWQIDPSIRAMVKFRLYNLLESPESLGIFDVVLCRNVLIYFDQETKARVLNSIADQLAEDGVLYLGAAETVLGVTDRFSPIPGQRGMYQLKGATPSIVSS